MSKEHTPTPWKHSGREIVTAYTGQGGRVIAIAAHGPISNAPVLDMGHDDWDLGMANLGFIVRAVNSHEALVEAAQFVKAFLVRLEDGLPENDPLTQARRKYHAPLHAKIDAALALADKDS